ncbi:MAG TPA: hypothetical protein VGK73_10965 [Polyangiaceae bacterium]
MRPALRSGSLLTVLFALAATGALVGRAAAQAPSAGSGKLEQQLAELKRQARELDEKIRRIEAELARQAATRVNASDATAAEQRAAAADCEQPFYIDSAGIKHVRPQCFERARQSSCEEQPFALDELGIRRLRPACEAGPAVRWFPIEE